MSEWVDTFNEDNTPEDGEHVLVLVRTRDKSYVIFEAQFRVFPGWKILHPPTNPYWIRFWMRKPKLPPYEDLKLLSDEEANLSK